MKTVFAKESDIKHEWYLIDAKDKILGRVATKVASLLKGKYKVNFTPHVDMGDGVVIVNSEKIRVTGKKPEQKMYKRYSGYPGGLTEEPLEHLKKRRPHEILRHAVKGMLPKNKLGRKMIRRLKIYVGEKHDQAAQQPKPIEL